MTTLKSYDILIQAPDPLPILKERIFEYDYDNEIDLQLFEMEDYYPERRTL